MASITKRGKKYSVVYSYDDADGVKRQKWETVPTKKEALRRKAQIEHEMNTGAFIPPTVQTVQDFLANFVTVYGKSKWGLSVYSSNTSLIRNYINLCWEPALCRM